MTVVNPKSISGINSITMASGSDDLLTIHSNNTTERVRVNNSGDVIIGSGVTLSPDGDIFATGITTISENLKVGTGVTISPDGDAFFTGVCTATTFKGDGSQLSGISADVVDDTSPQLGGDLQSNGHDIKIADATGYDGNNIYMGSDNDCRIIHDGSNFSITEATGDATIQSADDIFLKPQGGEDGIKIIGDGAVELYHNNTKQCETSASGLAFPSGKGIDFSATGDGTSATSVAEILDDYEEGLFTPYMAYSPTSNDPAYSDQVGQYVKIGKLVTFQARINLTSAGTGNANLKITNFPFAPSPSSSALSNPMVTVKPVVGVDVGGDREIFAQFEGGNTSLVLYTFGIESSSDYASFTQSNIDNNAQVAVFGHYYTDS